MRKPGLNVGDVGSEPALQTSGLNDISFTSLKRTWVLCLWFCYSPIDHVTVLLWNQGCHFPPFLLCIRSTHTFILLPSLHLSYFNLRTIFSKKLSLSPLCMYSHGILYFFLEHLSQLHSNNYVLISGSLQVKVMTFLVITVLPQWGAMQNSSQSWMQKLWLNKSKFSVYKFPPL